MNNQQKLIVYIIAAALVMPTFAAEKSNDEIFQETMQYANLLRSRVKKEKETGLITVEGDVNKVKPLTFKPQEVFNKYTDTPSQTGYYDGITQENVRDMEKAAIAETVKDEDYKDDKGNPIATPAKTVTESFQTKPVFKINKNDEYIKKGNLITSNAKNIVTGVSNKDINCQDNQPICTPTYIEKTCNEEVRTIKRICEEAIEPSVDTKDTIYPNCQHMIVTQGARTYCPSGYSELYYSDMKKGPIWDDIRLCVKTITNNDSNECYIGYLVHGAHINTHTSRVANTERSVVPKKMYGRIRFSNIYDESMAVTIVNETTGETLYNNGRFNNGQTIPLPYSETKDQTFRFYINKHNNGYWGESFVGGKGVMVLYVDRISREKVANMKWVETRGSCHDI